MPTIKTNKRWEIIAGRDCQSGSPPKLAEIPAPVITILANRGINKPDDIKHFLSPSLDQLPPPQHFLGMSEAVAILVHARTTRTPVLVYGDYDADGVTATALLVRFFREIDLPVFHFIPERIRDGYGLNSDSLVSLRAMPQFVEHLAPVLLTVDCGISSSEEIAVAKTLGFQVIVTDHHLPGASLPAADAIINPQQADCPFPFNELAGVGVAFYLVAGLRHELVKRGVWSDCTPPNLKKYLDLVAIGSVADMVPLRGVNRILVKAGLEVINQSPCAGIQALRAQIDPKNCRVDPDVIAFSFSPKINAAGRLGSAEEALQLLLTDDQDLATKFAENLSQANQARKTLTEKMYQEACVQAASQRDEGRLVLVVSDKSWHPGIVGLVASRLATEYSRPSVAFALDDEGWARGSVRSVGRLDIYCCLMECEGILHKFGGHSQAAGLTIRAENIERFKMLLEASIGKRMGLADMELRLEIDLAADPAEIINAGILNYLPFLEPCGKGNPAPTFCCHPKGIRLLEVKKVGTGSMRFKVAANGGAIKGIGFGMADWVGHAEGLPVRLAYRFWRSDYRGKESWELRVEDIKESG